MNKYKKSFTPEEVALIAAGFTDFSSIDDALIFIVEEEIKNVEEDLAKRAKIKEAQEIKEAIIDDVWHAYEHLHNGADKKTKLEISSEGWDEHEEFPWTFNPIKTKLTKYSIFQWFQDHNQSDLAAKFMPPAPTRLKKVNKFKKGFTPEHCALLATKLENYRSIKQAMDCSEHQELEINQQAIDAHRDNWYEIDIDENLENGSIHLAQDIKETLIDELKLAYSWINYESSALEYASIGEPCPEPPFPTDIQIFLECMDSNSVPDYENTLISKESFAIWLWNEGHQELANNVQANISTIIENIPKSHTWTTLEKKTVSNTENKLRVPEESLITSLGIMALLLSKKHTRLSRADKPNAAQIKDAVSQAIEALGLDNSDNKPMISNLNKDIATALTHLEDKLK